MQIRDAIDRRPKVAIAVVILLIAVCAYMVVRSLSSGGDSSAASLGANKAFFTVDDGKTWFVDDVSKLPPFPHEGKEAVRAYIFSADGGKTKFVGFLERYTPRAKAHLVAARAAAKPDSPDEPGADMPAVDSLEIKKPGVKTWTPIRSPQANEIRKLTAPGGGTPVPVLP